MRRASELCAFRFNSFTDKTNDYECEGLSFLANRSSACRAVPSIIVSSFAIASSGVSLVLLSSQLVASAASDTQ